MELRAALKMAESTLTLNADRVSALSGKLEDIWFRAQRLANAIKNKLPVQDTMFGQDLQKFRAEVRTFSHEVAALPNIVGSIERTAYYDEEAQKAAGSLQRICERIAKQLKSLADTAHLAHGHMRVPEHKIEAWYLAQECEEMADKGRALPTLCNKLVLRVNDAKTKPADAPNPAPPPAKQG